MSSSCPWGREFPNLSQEKLTPEQKTWIANQIIEKKHPPKYFTEKYKLDNKLVSGWAKKVRKGQKLHSGKGQPAKITPSIERIIQERIENNVYMNQPNEIKEMLQELVDKDLEDRGLMPGIFRKLDKKTIERAKRSMGINSGNAEFTTNARADATASLRNLVSHAVQVFYQTNVRKVPPLLHLNADGSAFTVGYSSDNKVVVVFIKKEHPIPDAADKFRQVLPKKGEQKVGLYTVKIYAYVSAEGVAFPPIFIIQDETMEADDMDVHLVKGLGLGTNWDAYGYVVFMKSRCGHSKFYKWFFEEVHMKSVVDLKAYYNLPDTTATNLQIDGEDIQMSCLNDEALRAKLLDLNINVTKSFHSGTAISQPCDAGNMFRGSKKVNKHLRDGDIINLALLKRVQAVFKLHNSKMNPSEGQSSEGTRRGRKPKRTKGVTDAHAKMGAIGIMRVQYSFQASVTPRTISKSFKNTGNVPYDLKHIHSLMRSTASEKVGREEYDRIVACFPELVRRYGLQGELYETDYKDFDIREDKNPGTVPRDQRILRQRRSVNLTCPRVWDRLKEQAAEKEQRAMVAEREKVTRAVERKRKKEESEQKRAAKVARVAK